MKKHWMILGSVLLLLTGCGTESPSDTLGTEPETAYILPESLSVKEAVTIPLDPAAYGDSFNRITLDYTADGPLQCIFRYTCDGEPVEDAFFLEEGSFAFSGLTESYMDRESAGVLSEITFVPLDGSVSLELHALETQTVPFPDSSGMQYLENERFKVGIHLKWGGAISYIEDKTCPLDGVQNLVNEADTGRLIQQSWYGTGDPDIYVDAEFNNSRWVYNPVQGGDKYMNHSRIIDLSVTENSIYVKTQAQDWALNGHLTPSYMENTYTLQDDVIRVDNRFVDFSGWEHPAAGQELPAFYIISYLDSFVWYDGAAPWTGDALSIRDDLRFWGDPEFRNDSDFPVKHSNTETWCAWVRTQEDYGIGLYIPQVDRLIAGRHAYSGSRDPKNNACNYFAPVNRIQLISYRPIEYSYLIAAGSVQSMRDTFTAHRDFTDNTDLAEQKLYNRVPDSPMDFTALDFTDPATLSILTAPLNTVLSYDETEGAAKLYTSVGFDVQSTLDFSLAERSMLAEECGKVVVEYKIPATNSRSAYGCEFFLCAGDVKNPTGGISVHGEYICDGEYHTLEIPLTGLDFWKGEIHSVRFDHFNECDDGDVLYLRSIRFLP
ncbi:MAG: hypothetical protein II979_06340 [Clostridia bacterium]|nr:hypothetical protein [Clostridia bacterium]